MLLFFLLYHCGYTMKYQ